MDDNEEAVAGGGSVESFTKLSKEGQLPKIKSWNNRQRQKNWTTGKYFFCFKDVNTGCTI